MNALQIFLLLNAVLVGVVLTIAVQHAIAHFRPKPKEKLASSTNHLPPEVRERLVKQAEANFQGIVNRSALQLQTDLGTTGSQLNKLLEKFGSEVLDEEMKLFRANMKDLRAQTETSLSAAQTDITKQQTEVLRAVATRQAELDARLSERQKQLEAELETSFATQKEQLSALLQTKLNDAVLAFLLETLGHDVDLGSQADYLIATLEANKQQLIKGVVDEA